MKDNIEVIETIYKDSDMSIKSLDTLLQLLENKQNGITKLIVEIKNGYQTFKEIACDFLDTCKLSKKQTSKMAVMMASKNIKKEVKCDNSDPAIAWMVIKGIDMGVDTIKKLLDNPLKEEYARLGRKFLKFQTESITKLKRYA